MKVEEWELSKDPRTEHGTSVDEQILEPVTGTQRLRDPVSSCRACGSPGVPMVMLIQYNVRSGFCVRMALNCRFDRVTFESTMVLSGVISGFQMSAMITRCAEAIVVAQARVASGRNNIVLMTWFGYLKHSR